MNIVVENPYAILFGTPLLILAILVWRRARRVRRVYGRIYGLSSYRKILLLDLIKVLILVLLLIALANPSIVYSKKIVVDNEEKLVKYSGKLPVHAIILVDVSPSMHRGNRLAEAQQAIRFIVASLNKTDYLTIAVFGKEVNMVYNGKPTGFKSLNLSSYEIKYTSIPNALGWASGYAKITGLPSIVFIISDGANNYGGDPLEAILSMNASGTPVVFIKTGDDPRAYSLISELTRKDIPVLDIHMLDQASIKYLIEKAVLEAKLDTLVSSGKSYVVVEEKIPLPRYLFLVTALILLVLSRVEGV